MAGITRVDVNKLKVFASKTFDRARPAYGRARIDRPRRCIFVGTTNDEEYLRDDTGNRRFWPVKVPDGFLIDLDGFREIRDQLWAEAVVLEAMVDTAGQKEPLVISKDLWGAAAVEVAKREGGEPWEEVLVGLIVDGRPGPGYASLIDGTQSDPLGEPEWRIATADLLEHVLEIPPNRQYKTHMTRLAKAMRRLGWQKPDAAFKIRKKSANGYRRPKS